MKASWALTKKAQYALVYQKGSTYIDRLIVMKVLSNGLDLSRYGFAITKKVGKAVQRNRLKRLFRQIVGSKLLKPGWDIVFIVRRRAVDTDYHQLEKAIAGLLSRARLL